MPYFISGNVIFLIGTCFYQSNLFERPSISKQLKILRQWMREYENERKVE
jgi:hypothetical protein